MTKLPAALQKLLEVHANNFALQQANDTGYDKITIGWDDASSLSYDSFKQGTQFCWDAVAPMLQKYEEALRFYAREHKHVRTSIWEVNRAEQALQTVRTELNGE